MCEERGRAFPDNLRCQLIRESVTCRKAERGESITNNAFKIASKVIHVEVPELADMQLPK